jgi:hypothetical protein
LGMRKQITLILLTALVLPLVVVAQPKGTKTFKWVDENGKVHYGDSVPPEYAKIDRDVLNSQGVKVGSEEGEITPEERAAMAKKKAEEDARLAAKAEVARRDRMLLQTYLSVADIEDLRDRRLELLESQIKVTELYLANLRKRLTQLKDEASNYKPYTERENAPPVPETLASDISRTTSSIDNYERSTATSRVSASSRAASSAAARVAEAAAAAIACGEIFHDCELGLQDGDDHELRNALARLDPEVFRAAVPARDHELALIVGVDEANEVAEHDAVLVAEARARNDDRGKRRVGDVDREPGVDQLAGARCEVDGGIEAGP